MAEGWMILGISGLGIIICMIGLITCKSRYRKQRKKLLDRMERE